MKYDISALGNALVDTQYMVDHDFLKDIGLEPDSMTLASAEEHAPIIKKLKEMGVESISDCGGSATNSLVAASYYGSNCHHVCRVADDEDGEKYLDSLQKAGVKHIGFSKEESETTNWEMSNFCYSRCKKNNEQYVRNKCLSWTKRYRL